MGLSVTERLNLLVKTFSAGVIDANSVATWYESAFPYSNIIDPQKVWADTATLKANPAGDLTTAQANAAGPLTGIVADLSAPTAAVRLTKFPGMNDSTYVAYSTYNNLASAVVDNWILPQYIPQANGFPSNGYAIRLWEGDPNLGGVEITTSEGTTGTGANKTVGWLWNYASGVLLLSEDFKSNITDPYVTGFRYTGAVVGGSVTVPFSYHFPMYAAANTISRYQGWVSAPAKLLTARVYLDVLNTNGQYILELTNVGTGNSMLATASFDMNSLTAGVPTSLLLTGTLGDLTFPSAGDRWDVKLTSNDPNFNGLGPFIELYFEAL